ncbi:MAG: hypothetical protein H6718_03360 [Polyangiaceae bacterium]|nr:hypothetical protein [Polyangiaceae bacterium]
MARPWLVSLAMLTQTGCLLGEAPEYQSRRQTPPVLLTSSADPSLNRVIRVQTSETIEFKVLYRSEDAGDPMTAILFRDFRADSDLPQIVNSTEFEPSSNLYPDEGDPTQAVLSYNFRDSDKGCHSYTMMLSHSSNVNVFRPRDNGDVALVTWWAAVQDENGEPTDILVDECGASQ